MAERITLWAETILDPRGVAPPTRRLAARAGSLVGKQVVLFDNTKLQFGRYQELYTVLEGRLRAAGVAATPRITRQLRGEAGAQVGAVAREIVAAGADAAVVALADMGVSPATALLGLALEEAGCPAAVVCAEPGVRLARAVARHQGPGLALCEVAVDQATPAEAVRAQGERLADEVLWALTTPAEEVERRSRQRLGLGAEEPNPARWSTSMALTAQFGEARVAPDLFADQLFDFLCDQHLTDGLPMIAPTRARVRRMLQYSDRPARRVLLPAFQPSGAPLTVEKLAIAAVMAGCRPEYFPVVLTAFEAMVGPAYALTQSVTTSHPAGNLVLVSGPIAREIGMNASWGCAGPGNRANATIGRAVNLAIITVARAVPGVVDLATHGSPAEYSWCVAENEDESPWPALHTEWFDEGTTTVTVHKCEGPRDVVEYVSEGPEPIVGAIAATATSLGVNNAYMPSHLVVLLSPFHAELIARAGWSRRDVQQRIYEQARNPRALLEGRGIVPLWPPELRGLERVPCVASPDEVLVVVCGGRGVHSAVALPWGMSHAVTRPITRADGRHARSVTDFLRP